MKKRKIIDINTDELVFPFEQAEIEKADRILKLEDEYRAREKKKAEEEVRRQKLEEKKTTEEEKEILEEKAGDIKKLYSLDYWMRCWDRVSYCNEVSGQAMFHVVLGQALNTFKIFLEDDSEIDWRLHFLLIQDSGCLQEDTLIETANGKKKLKDLPELFDLISYNLKTKQEEFSIAKKIDSGKKKLFRIKLVDGRIVEASEDHIFFDEKGKEVRVKDLQKGYKILTK